ncbi:MAG: magnesium transporter [Nitrospirae bacterium]|nr:magnesium transporter [Candidatus Manganitrophaceae bacterium]
MKSAQTEDTLKENIATVRELLTQRKREEETEDQRSAENQEATKSLFQYQHWLELQAILKPLHIGDIAHILEILPLDDRLTVWQQVNIFRRGDVLLEVSDAVRENLIQSISEEDLLAALNLMDADDLAYIADDIPEDLLKIRQKTLTTEDKNWLRRAMSYEEDSVGFLMSNEMVVIYDNDALKDAAKILRGLEKLPIHNDTLFVVDRRGILRGILSLQNILLNDPNLPVHNIMETDIVYFSPQDDAGEASQAFERYDLVSAPVISDRGKLVGRLTVDVVMDYIRDEATEDVLNMAGISAEEDLFAPILNSARNRALWLLFNLGAAFFISQIIGIFEATITQLVSLAVLMPIVTSVGGNIGNQTAAIIIRGMTLGQINKENTTYLMRKELGVSALNGLVIGSIVGIFSFILYKNIALSIVISVAMLLTLILAALLGLLVPIFLHRIGRDPALGSSVIMTATIDSVGFFIFLGLASIFLVK